MQTYSTFNMSSKEQTKQIEDFHNTINKPSKSKGRYNLKIDIKSRLCKVLNFYFADTKPKRRSNLALVLGVAFHYFGMEELPFQQKEEVNNCLFSDLSDMLED